MSPEISWKWSQKVCQKLKAKQISAGRHNAGREKGKAVFSEWTLSFPQNNTGS